MDSITIYDLRGKLFSSTTVYLPYKFCYMLSIFSVWPIQVQVAPSIQLVGYNYREWGKPH